MSGKVRAVASASAGFIKYQKNCLVAWLGAVGNAKLISTNLEEIFLVEEVWLSQVSLKCLWKQKSQKNFL